MSSLTKARAGRPSPPARSGSSGGAAPATSEALPIDHEELVVRRGRRSGRYVMVAIHSTRLGPALGGARMWHYEAPAEAFSDALRLASAMTWKAAVAGLELGGGKGVICAPGSPPSRVERRDMLLDFGDLVESLGGRYITAEDVGTSAADLVTIHERSAHVTGLPPDRGGSGDPSEATAIGVEAAMRACAAARFGSPDLHGLRVVVVGLGHVGEKLAGRLTGAGALVTASDIDPSKRDLAWQRGAGWSDPSAALLAECDVLAPCALGGVITGENAARLRCEIVCGCANNQLADDALARDLAARGILYAPDFVANAGGLIHVYREIKGYSEDEAEALVLEIGATMGRVLAAAGERAITPLDAARALASERLRAAALA